MGRKEPNKPPTFKRPTPPTPPPKLSSPLKYKIRNIKCMTYYDPSRPIMTNLNKVCPINSDICPILSEEVE